MALTLLNSILSALILTLTVVTSVSAKVTLPSIFSDGMVIQRDRTNCVWGKAARYERIKVQIDSQNQNTNADLNGDWIVKIAPLKPGGPRTMIVTGENKIAIKNLIVGDVFLCSGQSNMEFPLSLSDYKQEDIADVKKLQLHFYKPVARVSQKEVFEPGGTWKSVSAESFSNLPAVPYLFGRKLCLDRKIPIGIICCPCGGATIESFLPPETATRMANELNPVLAPSVISSNFRTLLYPFLKFGFKGILWYQGESNLIAAKHYRNLFPAFITDLRKRMTDKELPFYFVQLPSFGWRQEDNIVDSYWADLREAQAQALKLGKVSMVVSLDTAVDGPPVHPKEKRLIAWRLAELVESEETGQLKQPPDLAKISFDAESAVLVFKPTNIKFHTEDGRKVRGFQLAGKDKKFYFADAEIKGNIVKITSDEVFSPCALRYAWADNPDANLYFDDHQPLAPFRSDRWPTFPKLNSKALAKAADD